MDGNGRWAKERNLTRTAGHEAGVATVRDITIHCSNLGIKYLTLYAFSTENWNRPKLEVEFLMKLLEKYLKLNYQFIYKIMFVLKLLAIFQDFLNLYKKLS